ncbi:hypothetical protein L3Y34_019168 [Caenorhabditis briggsae]|uniref:Uncharacterized protein n=1 Tax=Caenorhabditis briggsae TaxID=6238 RepID=A0AAE9DM79_CAEBR|nr:hypothetical protein L3Y34_019168 [Caenorhabditis briggsae]
MTDTNKMLLSKIQALKTGLHEVKNIVIENLTSQKSQQYLTEELVENQKEREIQKKLCESYVAVHEPTLLELEDSRKIQKEQEEKINILTEENKKFIEIRQKLNEENEKLCEELGEMKRKLEDFEEKKTFQIFIKIRHYITLDMKKSDTIADVKKKLFKRGVFCNNCLLVYGGY